MTLTELAIEKGIEPEKAREFLLEVFSDFPELNINNYHHEDVCALNNWCIEQVLAARPNMEDL